MSTKAKRPGPKRPAEYQRISREADWRALALRLKTKPAGREYAVQHVLRTELAGDIHARSIAELIVALAHGGKVDGKRITVASELRRGIKLGLFRTWAECQEKATVLAELTNKAAFSRARADVERHRGKLAKR